MAKKSRSYPYVAVNMAKILNNPASFETMKKVGPKVCITTASNPGFLGYMANLQTGIFPMAGRFGGASIHMEKTLNPLRLYQYTIWQSAEDHLDFHKTQFARVFELCVHCFSMVVEGPWEPVFELCVHCFSMVVEGPWEPVYSIVCADLPPVCTAVSQAGAEQKRVVPPSRTVAVTEHVVKLGEEAKFEAGLIDCVSALSDSPGFLGYMLLKPEGVNPLGSFALDPASAYEMLMTLGANPPSKPQPRFTPAEALAQPLEYLLYSEWESPELAEAGLGRAMVDHKIRTLYAQRVLAHTIRAGYTTLFRTMMEQPSWRKSL